MYLVYSSLFAIDKKSLPRQRQQTFLSHALAVATTRSRIAFRLAGNTSGPERSRLNLNGSRQLSKSATELRDSDIANSSPSRRGDVSGESGIVHHHRHHRHHGTSVAQRTHTFFATLKSRWTRSRSKERKKSKDTGSVQSQDASQLKNPGAESDYAADYSSEHSRSSSATQSPARHCLNRPGKRCFSDRHFINLCQIYIMPDLSDLKEQTLSSMKSMVNKNFRLEKETQG